MLSIIRNTAPDLKCICVKSKEEVEEEIASVPEMPDLTLADMLEGRCMRIVGGSGVDFPKDILKLVYFMAENNILLKNFYHSLRRSIALKKTALNYPTKDMSAAEKNAATEFTNMLSKYGILTACHIEGGLINAEISSAPKVISFINGEWLEIFAAGVAREVLEEFSAESASRTDGEAVAGYEIYKNLKVMDTLTGQKNELDLAIRFNNQMFLCECKSGTHFYDYNKYRELGNHLSLIPDNFLLLSSSVEGEDCAEAISFFYDYMISDVENFREKLIKMLKTNGNDRELY